VQRDDDNDVDISIATPRQLYPSTHNIDNIWTIAWRCVSMVVPVPLDTFWRGHFFITIDPLVIIETLDEYAIEYGPRFQVTACLVKERERRFRVP